MAMPARHPRAVTSILLAVACSLGGTVVPARAASATRIPRPAAAPEVPGPSVADGRVLVGLQPGTPATVVQDLARRAGAVAATRAGDTLVVTPDGTAGAAGAAGSAGVVSARARALRRDPHVRYVAPNVTLQAQDVPNDPGLGFQYALGDAQPGGIRAQSAWRTTTGSRDVVVGVLDTGADLDHEDLAANLWDNTDATGGCAFGTHGYDAVGDDCVPDDDDGHGTHVSGILGAVGDNGIGITGTAPHVSLMELRMLRRNPQPGLPATGSVADAVEAIDWALAAKASGVNLRVLQASWGAPFPDDASAAPLRDAITRARDAGVLFVAAAGNSSQDLDGFGLYPCGFDLDNVICVGATTPTGALAPFSDYGIATVDLAAPGIGIVSTVPPGLLPECDPEASYCALDGTSMSTPFVSGGAAMIATAEPTLGLPALRARILGAVTPLPGLAGKVATGGRFDLCAAIPGCGSIPAVPPSAPEDLTAAVSGMQATLSWSAPASNGDGDGVTGYRVRWGGSTTVLPVAGTGGTSTLAGLTPDVDVPVTVEATNDSSLGSAVWGPAATVVVRVHDGVAPSVVRALTASPTGTALDLTWTAPATAGGGTVTGYRVVGPGFTRYLGAPTGGGPPPTTLTVPGMTTGTFTVAATNMLPLDGPGTVWGPGATSTVTAAPTGEYTPLSPARVLDTRNGTGGRWGALGPGSVYDLRVLGAGGVPSTGVAAVVLNVTVTAPTAAGHLDVWPAGSARPTVSNLNFTPGRTVPNLVTVKVGTGGAVSILNSAGTSHVIADVVGFYADAAGSPGSRFHPLVPARLFDTRNGQGGVPAQPVGPTAVLRFDVSGAGGVPASGVTAVVLNVTVTAPSDAGFLTVFPDDVGVPTASSLNFVPGQTVPNLVAVRVPASGVVDVFNSRGWTHVLADVVGYYDGTKATEAGRFVPLDPVRLLDTREVGTPLQPGAPWLLPVAGQADVPGAGTGAAVVNVTVTEPTGAGWLSVFPDDACAVPGTSNLNFTPGLTVANLTIARLSGMAGCASLPGAVDFASNATTHVIADLSGYFTS